MDVFGAPSRRLCNLPYVLYQVGLINSFLVYLLVLDRSLVNRHQTMVEAVINYGQLQYFVYSNLLTGLANLVFWTYYAGIGFSVMVMVAYFAISAVIVSGCRRYKVRVDF